MYENKKTDSVAFLFDTGNLTDEQINEIKAIVRKQVSDRLGIDVGIIRDQRFISAHGGVVIYQP